MGRHKDVVKEMTRAKMKSGRRNFKQEQVQLER